MPCVKKKALTTEVVKQSCHLIEVELLNFLSCLLATCKDVTICHYGDISHATLVNDRLSQSKACLITCSRGCCTKFDAYDVFLNVFYLPTLKQIMHMTNWKQVMFWCVHPIACRVNRMMWREVQAL